MAAKITIDGRSSAQPSNRVTKIISKFVCLEFNAD
jgi:hypothetical protein